MKCRRIISLLCVMALAVSLMGCGGSKKITAGTYISQDEDKREYPPTISLFEDDTYQFNLVVGSYFSGTYTLDGEQLTLTMDNNASKFADDEIKELVFDVDLDAKELTSKQEIPEFMNEGTIFKL